MSDQRENNGVRRCACANIRRTDRVITQLSDEHLAPSGLNGTQFAPLVTLTDVAPITINNRAEIMMLDRTTLTRNLEVLIKQQMIERREGKDRRMRLIQPTEAGKQALEQAWPLWEKAQAKIEGALGRARFDALLAELATVRELAK